MAQQLQFGGEGVEEGRVMELATRVEDLTYQLGMRNVELGKVVQRGENAEVSI